MPIDLSDCCRAPVVIGGSHDRDGTNYFVCTDCCEPCDLAPPDDAIERLIERSAHAG